jgi:hypothetical protein
MIALPYLTRCIPGWNGPYPSRLAPVPLYRIAGVEVKLGFFCFFGEFGFVYIMNKLYVAANALVYSPICTKGYSHASKDCTFLEGGREWVSNVTINYILLSNSKDSSISLSLHLSMLFRAFFLKKKFNTCKCDIIYYYYFSAHILSQRRGRICHQVYSDHASSSITTTTTDCQFQFNM